MTPMRDSQLVEPDPYETVYPAEGAAGMPMPVVANSAPKHLLAFLAPPEAPEELGRLGSFRVLEVLGSGGMGVVFRAEDAQLGRQVALKTMLPSLAGNSEARFRFLREARAAAALKNDHIVAIYQVGEDQGVPYLTMELLEGESLEARLGRETKLPLAEVLELGRQAALALGAAHERGLIHRDIKPANIFLERGDPSGLIPARSKILDFGLASAQQQEGRLTQVGVIIGTPGYMAPEQTQGREVDFRCDLFSLGCVLYQAATGQRPFHKYDAVSTLLAITRDTPAVPHLVDAQLPAAFSELVMQLLAKDPRARIASASALASALAELQHAAATPAAGTWPIRLLSDGSWLDNVRAALPRCSAGLADEELVERLLQLHGAETAPRKSAAREKLNRDLALHAVRHPAAEFALPALLKLIKAGRGPYQRLAAACLQQVGPTEAEAADFLIEKLHDAHKEVRTWAVRCLEQMGPTTEASVPRLLQALDDEEEAIRGWASVCLGKIGPAAADAIDGLLRTLKGAAPELRMQVLEALGAIGGDAPRIVPRLLQALRHHEPLVRAQAAVALGRFPAAAADFLPALQEAAADHDELVRQSAQATLQEIRRAECQEPERGKTRFLAVACTCGKRLRIPAEYAGKRGRCPSCGRRAVLPGPTSRQQG